MNVWSRGSRVVSSAGLGAAFLAAVATQAIAIAQSWGARYWLFGGTAAVAVCLLALLRARHRTGTAAVALAVAALTVPVARLADLPAEPGPAMALGLSVLVGSAVRAQPPVPAGAIAGAWLAVIAGSQLAARPSASGITAAATINCLAWLAAVAAGLSLRLLDARARATVEQVRNDERLELARELHDVVTHHLTGMLIQTQAARILARKHPEQVVDSLAGIEAAGSDALTAMRRIVGLLRDTGDAAPASAEPEPLSGLVERFNRHHPHGPTAYLRMPDRDLSLPPEVTSSVYRLVREALTNVARHAPQADSVTVTVDQDPTGIRVAIVDDAPHALARHHHGGGYGLVGMRERVETLGGTLSAGPGMDTGWTVRATLPLTRPEPR